ncbi:O-methyltransferase [Seminavis robusta]|uniref:O-methyltransferase n=1 Tax=Seminavis robusta TaxID=568900 RepID=A0A9N8DQ79_9STRA|nr:O-methyltransferase [Seminavis robusta]|eukprot:Sro206_g086590.1 O-methyltransferase (450) ;mRNA; f:52721-54070
MGSSTRRRFLPFIVLFSGLSLASLGSKSSWKESYFAYPYRSLRTVVVEDDSIRDIATDWNLRQAFANLSYTSAHPESCQQRKLERFCRRARCQRATAREASPHDAQLPFNATITKQHDNTNNCKTLWFAGMSLGPNSQCTSEGGGYQREYAMALASARLHAADSLQPVLILTTRGTTTTNNPNISALDYPIARWAQSQGAIVVTVNELSFQSVANQLAGDLVGKEHTIGPYLRMDIPRIIRQYDLFRRANNICPRHVLYTDSDVLFVNPISVEDMHAVKRLVANEAHVTYGLEFGIQGDVPINTGVFVVDVPRWEQEWNSLLAFATSNGPFVAFDQGWLNAYYKNHPEKVVMLPRRWNWKTYWDLEEQEESSWTDIKIVHFHGPKPGLGLWDMATCASPTNWTFREDFVKAYMPHLQAGVCCNQGKVAHYAQQIYNLLEPVTRDVCLSV